MLAPVTVLQNLGSPYCQFRSLYSPQSGAGMIPGEGFIPFKFSAGVPRNFAGTSLGYFAYPEPERRGL